MSTDVFLVSDHHRIHRAVVDDNGLLMTNESDNADDMKGYTVTSELPEWAEFTHMCRRCFPVPDAPDGGNVPE